jgi:hypothetical protein
MLLIEAYFLLIEFIMFYIKNNVCVFYLRAL